MNQFTVNLNEPFFRSFYFFWAVGLVVLLVLVYVLLWYIVRYWKQRRQWENFVKNRTSSLIVQNLSWQEFEKWTEQMFINIGAKTKHMGRQGDHGVDLEVEYLGKKIIVQCKKYYGDKKVGEPDIRGAFGVMHGGGFHKAVVITTGNFSWEAIKWAKGKQGLVLINGSLIDKIRVNSQVLKDILNRE